MRYVKDEAGDPLTHIGPLREKTSEQIKVFSGSHGRKLMEEMPLGFSGSMPAASLPTCTPRRGTSGTRAIASKPRRCTRGL